MSLWWLTPNPAQSKYGSRAILVEASSFAKAQKLAELVLGRDDSWLDSSGAVVPTTGASNFTGWKFRVLVSGPTGDRADVTLTCTTAQVTRDDLGNALVTLLVAKGLTASYAANTLTVAAIADN